MTNCVTSTTTSAAYPADRDVSLATVASIVFDSVADAFKVVSFAAEVDLESEVAREALDRVERSAPFARFGVVRLGEDQPDVMSALLAEFLFGVFRGGSGLSVHGRVAHAPE